MKKMAFFAVLLLVPSALGQVAWFEDFEDQTSGQQPTSPNYVVSGDDMTVRGGGNPGQELHFTDSDTNKDNMALSNGLDLCDPGSEVSVDLQMSTPSDHGFGGVFWFRNSGPPGGTSGRMWSGMGLEKDNAGNFFLMVSDGFGSSQTLVNSLFQYGSAWNSLRFYDFDCSSPSGLKLDISNGLGTFTVTRSHTVSFGDLDNIQGGRISTQSNFPSVDIDNLLVNGQVLFAVDPPTGLEGEVIKTGSVSTTGKIDLEWNLSPDDTNQDVGDLDYHIYLEGVKIATDTVDADDGGGVRKYTYTFTGSESFGLANFTVTAEGLYESDPSCEITVDQDTLNSQDSCGDAVLAGSSPAEFDTGFVAAVESFGFFTNESQHFFALILVGMVTVVTGAASKWVAPSRWKNMMILGSGALIAVFTVLISFLELWEFLVALMIGIFAVRGAGEARNTFFEIQEALKRRREPDTQDLEAQVLEDPIKEFNEEVDQIFERIEAQEAPNEPPESVEASNGGTEP